VKLTLSVNTFIQVLALIVQYLNVAAGIVPQKYQPWIAGALVVMQGLVGILAHFANPDGTPAKVAYLPPGKQNGVGA